MSTGKPAVVRYSRAAKLDIKDAARWLQHTYSPSVAQQFLRAVEERVADAAENPEACGVVYRAVRKALVSRFPYSVFYVYDGKRLRVLAVMHWRRDPFDWQVRVR